MQAVARRRARQAAADHGAALPVDRVPPCAVSRARRQPMAAAARAATALMPAKPPVAMPIVRRPFMPEARSEEHTSELQSLMRISYAVFCLKKQNNKHHTPTTRSRLHRHE